VKSGRRELLCAGLSAAGLGAAGLARSALLAGSRALGVGSALASSTLLGGCRAGGRRGHEIALWFSYGGENRRVLLELVAEFNGTQSEVRVVPTFQGDYFEGLAKIRTALFAGAPPTLTHVVGEVVPYLFEAGVLEPLDEIGGEVMADLLPALAQAGTFLGGAERPLVALPFNRSTPIAFYDKTLFAKLDLRPPTTWDELRAVAARATKRAGDGRHEGAVERWGFECPVDWWFWVALVGQAGGELVRPTDGRVTLGDEAGVRALELWRDLVHRDRTMKPPPGRDYDAWQATNIDFLSGRAAMIWTSTAFLRYLERNAAFEVGAAPLPQLQRPSVPTGGTMFVMPRPRHGAIPTDDRQAAMRFLRWMMAPAQANAWATRTGYMPVSRAGLARLEADGYYQRHPNDRVTIDQLASVRPWPWAAELFRVQREVVQPRLEEVVLRNRDARAALDEARRSAAEP
jgi:sn-glycerol 3-phosphate transport system substrate-binding protein